MKKVMISSPNWLKNTSMSYDYVGSEAYAWSYSLKGVKSIIYTIKKQEEK